MRGSCSRPACRGSRTGADVTTPVSSPMVALAGVWTALQVTCQRRDENPSAVTTWTPRAVAAARNRHAGRPIAHPAEKIEYARLLRDQGSSLGGNRRQDRHPEDIPAPLPRPASTGLSREPRERTRPARCRNSCNPGAGTITERLPGPGGIRCRPGAWTAPPPGSLRPSWTPPGTAAAAMTLTLTLEIMTSAPAQPVPEPKTFRSHLPAIAAAAGTVLAAVLGSLIGATGTVAGIAIGSLVSGTCSWWTEWGIRRSAAIAAARATAIRARGRPLRPGEDAAVA